MQNLGVQKKLSTANGGIFMEVNSSSIYTFRDCWYNRGRTEKHNSSIIQFRENSYEKALDFDASVTLVFVRSDMIHT